VRWDIVYNNLDYLLWGSYPNGPLGGIAASIMLAVLGIFGAFWLGLGFGLMRLSGSRLLRGLSMVYVEVIRGTPLLMVIFWFYFLGPVVFDYHLPEFHSALMAFVVFTVASVAEIGRAGVNALPGGQMEAARGAGLTRFQAMCHVILPQALRNMIPSFVNQFVSLTKDTSLAYIIGVNELTKAATQINNREVVAPAEIFMAIAVLYFLICWVLTAFSRRMERHLARYQARGR